MARLDDQLRRTLERILTGEVEVIDHKYSGAIMPLHLTITVLILPTQSSSVERRPMRDATPKTALPEVGT